jgi:hypothetical protein
VNKLDIFKQCAECAGAVCYTAIKGLECEQLLGQKSDVPPCGIPTIFNTATADDVSYTEEQLEDFRPHLVNGEWIPANTIFAETMTAEPNSDATPVKAIKEK